MEQVHNKLYKIKNQTDSQNDPKTCTVLEIAEKYLIPIDPEIVQKLGIKDGDIVFQVEDGTRTITLIFKDTKNRVGGKLPSNQPTIEGGYPT